MTVSFLRNGVTLSNAVNLRGDGDGGIEGMSSAAKHGEVGSGGVTIDDPTASLLPKGFDIFAAEESACAVARSWTGFITGRPITRLDARGTDTRRWDCDLIDLNTMLTWRVITGADGKRPAETDIARVAWLLGSTYLTDLHLDLGGIVDTGLANTTDNPVNLGEADYRHRTPADVLSDIAGVSGKTYWVRWDESAGAVGLFYDLAIAAVAQSTIRVSNDPADEDADTIAPEGEVVITRSPEDVYSGIDYMYKGVAIYRTRSATSSEFRIKRDLAYSTDRVGKAATAEALSALFLVDHAAEFDELEFTLVMSAAKLNLLLEGDACEVKFTHEPGYETFVWTRITRRVWDFEAPGVYRVKFNASLATLVSGGGGGGGGGFPWQGDCSDITPIDSAKNDETTLTDTHQLPTVTTAETGVLVVAFVETRPSDALVPPVGWTVRVDEVTDPGSGDDIRYSICDRYVAGSASPYEDVFEAAAPVRWCTFQAAFSADSAPVSNVASNSGEYGPSPGDTDPTISAAFTSTAGRVLLALASFTTFSGGTGPGITWPVGWVELEVIDPDSTFLGQMKAAFRIADGTETGIDVLVDSTKVASATVLVSEYFIDCVETLPLPGQEVPPRPADGTVDGSNTDFTTTHPFSDGSLRVWVDGIHVTDEITAVDGETGAFTLSFAPLAAVADVPAEEVITRYEGR